MSLNLNTGSNPIFDYYVQEHEPNPWWIGTKFLMRFTWWTRLRKKNGKRAVFFSLVLFGHFQCYIGTAKCDGTRTYMLRSGALGEVGEGYVMTGWKQEHWAFRWRKDSKNVSDRPEWSSMGSS